MRCSGSETAHASIPPMHAQRKPIPKKISDAEIRACHGSSEPTVLLRRGEWQLLSMHGCAYVYFYKCVHTCIRLYIHTYIHTYIHIYICIFIHVFYAFIHAWIYTYIHMYTHVIMYLRMYVYGQDSDERSELVPPPAGSMQAGGFSRFRPAPGHSTQRSDGN